MNRPKLILLIGPPGVGKSTYANELTEFECNIVHLSSDNIRAELWGDASIQGDNNEVFSLMQKRTIEALNNGKSVIYDSTNMTRKDRACIISQCPKFVHIEAHIIWVPIEMCIERDVNRERTVGKEVIDRMLKRFQPPYYDEGIDAIEIIKLEEFNCDSYRDNIDAAMKISHDNPHHSVGIKEHCLEAHLVAKAKGFDRDVQYAALYHDIGKPYTKAFMDSKGNPSETAHYYFHHNVSGWLAYGLPWASPFRVWLIGNHMEPFFNTKYYKNLPSYLKIYIDNLHECDLKAH